MFLVILFLLIFILFSPMYSLSRLSSFFQNVFFSSLLYIIAQFSLPLPLFPLLFEIGKEKPSNGLWLINSSYILNSSIDCFPFFLVYLPINKHCLRNLPPSPASFKVFSSWVTLIQHSLGTPYLYLFGPFLLSLLTYSFKASSSYLATKINIWPLT